MAQQCGSKVHGRLRPMPFFNCRNMAIPTPAASAALADCAALAEVGGSDAHAMASVGCAYTVVPRARSKEEFLRGLRHGFGRVRGETGNIWKLTRDVLAIGRSMVREDLRTLPAAPLALAVPAFTLGNYIVEQVFARWWMSRYRQSLAARRRNAATPIVEAAA